ncbi:Hypothetical Protein FCC1311_092572 [Hondaea fermentalgiana]|uniref:Uncharacterized protein n=1 Tax=Hondaea fermentalgiana TaxID=2315210 RepID=A0A2R5GWJ3_9STRA|nr:Hypothetical Protein FCC1311_092572 [Hondaea fermentalgiana]|eukprot:GBG33033.1 Hypothetical Protein FCC1311_092572 [Hondaea fermentalgiana]
MRRDERRMAQGEDIPRSVWLRQVAESEKTAPIRADKEMVERLARENVLAAELATRRARDQERQAERLAHLRAKIESSQQRNVEYRLRREEMETERAQLLVAQGEEQFAPGTDSRANDMIAAAPALDIANDDEPLYH